MIKVEARRPSKDILEEFPFYVQNTMELIDEEGNRHGVLMVECLKHSWRFGFRGEDGMRRITDEIEDMEDLSSLRLLLASFGLWMEELGG